MEKFYCFCLTYFLFTASLFAQAPQLMSYQAVIRNNNNILVANSAVSMRISVLQGSASGAPVYVETHSASTNANGLAMISIGGGAAQSGTFSGINWANGPYFVQSETDPNGGNNYSIIATSQLMSVPYALYSEKSAPGSVVGQMNYWNGSAWMGVAPGTNNQLLSYCDGVPTWGPCPGKVVSLNCGNANVAGLFFEGLLSDGTTKITYNGGNGGFYEEQNIFSTGVTGLTANLSAGVFTNGNGDLNFGITGIPLTSGLATFALNLGGKSCFFTINVYPAAVAYPSGSTFCSAGQTAIVNVTNPITGRIWMDRNLGASQIATSSTDYNAYGDLYQWGRLADGHQCRNSSVIALLSPWDQPGNSSFIQAPNSPYNWRTSQNPNLWQGVNGVNNPCPGTYRVPTQIEWESERLSWSNNNSIGAFSSPLKLPLAGRRSYGDGWLDINGNGYYWSSSASGGYSGILSFGTVGASIGQGIRSSGYSIRCIKD